MTNPVYAFENTSAYFPFHPLHPLQTATLAGTAAKDIAKHFIGFHKLDGDHGYINSIEQFANRYGSNGPTGTRTSISG